MELRCFGVILFSIEFSIATLLKSSTAGRF